MHLVYLTGKAHQVKRINENYLGFGERREGKKVASNVNLGITVAIPVKYRIMK